MLSFALLPFSATDQPKQMDAMYTSSIFVGNQLQSSSQTEMRNQDK